MKNITPLQLRFNDIDQMGHVNNAVIMEFFDLGKSNFFTEAGLPPESGDFTVMVVHVDVDFRSQIHFNDRIEVHTSIDRFGTKSLHLTQQIIKSTDGTLCAECHTVMSGYLRSEGRSAAIPDDYRQRLSL